MLRQLRPAALAVVIFTLLTGLVYPLAVTGIGQVAFAHEADGSEVVIDGQVVGSSLIAQPFAGPEWFHPRPSAVDYDAAGSGASNLGPTNPELLAAIAARADAFRTENDLDAGTRVPIDAVTASGSGLDPDISVRNARFQIARVASARGLSVDVVAALVADVTTSRTGGILGEPHVNVVTLNAALEQLAR